MHQAIKWLAAFGLGSGVMAENTYDGTKNAMFG